MNIPSLPCRGIETSIMKKITKITTAFITAVTILSLTACGKSQLSPEMEQAIKDLDSYCAKHPVCLRMDSMEYPEQNIIYDFTGDGSDDIITGIMFGSGLVRDIVIVYDVANQVFYTIGDEKDSYVIQEFDDGLLTVERYTYPDKYSTGKIVFYNNELVFRKITSREYFENLDKESSLEDIVEEIGPYGIRGSGIIYHVWKLDDGTEAHVVFNSKGKIEMIYIIDGDNSERIYKREH